MFSFDGNSYRPEASGRAIENQRSPQIFLGNIYDPNFDNI